MRSPPAKLRATYTAALLAVALLTYAGAYAGLFGG